MQTLNNLISPYLYPKPVTSWDFHTAVKSLEKERIARISRVAQFVFATATTSLLVILTEAPKVILSATLPVTLITIVSWVVFFKMKSWMEKFTEGLEDQKRAQLAKEAFEQLWRKKMEEFNSNKELENFFLQLNQLLGFSLFNQAYIQKIHFLRETCPPNKTFAEAAQEKQVDLSFKHEQTVVTKGFFGEPSTSLYVKAEWDGNPQKEVTFKMVKKPNEEQGQELLAK